VINRDTVHKANPTTLDLVHNFDSHSGYNSDGFPYGSDVTYISPGGVVALAFSNQVLILRTAGPAVPLAVDVSTISVATGGAAILSMDATNANASRKYLLLAGASGNSPGIPLKGVTLPVNWDVFTDIEMLLLNTPIFDNFMATLDIAGQGTATFDTLGSLSTNLIGLKMTFAFALKPFDYVSNYVEIEFTP